MSLVHDDVQLLQLLIVCVWVYRCLKFQNIFPIKTTLCGGRKILINSDQIVVLNCYCKPSCRAFLMLMQRSQNHAVKIQEKKYSLDNELFYRNTQKSTTMYPRWARWSSRKKIRNRRSTYVIFSSEARMEYMEDRLENNLPARINCIAVIRNSWYQVCVQSEPHPNQKLQRSPCVTPGHVITSCPGPRKLKCYGKSWFMVKWLGSFSKIRLNQRDSNKFASRELYFKAHTNLFFQLNNSTNCFK